MTTTWLTRILSTFSRPLKWWVVVAPWEQGLRVRLGKTSKLLTPGCHFRIPFVDRIYVKSTRLRTIHNDNQTVMTLDGRSVTVSIALSFSIADIQRLYERLATPETTLLFEAMAICSRWLGKNEAAALSAKQLEDAVNKRLDGEERGVAGLRCQVVSFTVVRTYRLLMNDYRSLTGLEKIEDEKGDI